MSIAVGHCDEINSPSKDIAVVAIEPDCKKQYGCLFCIHYLVHSDEADIHKLISFQYVIEAIRANAPNFEFSEDTFRDVAIRINAILEAVSQRSQASAELVVSIRKKYLIWVFSRHFGKGACSVMKRWGYTSNG